MPLGLPGAEVLIRAPLRFAEAVGTINRPLHMKITQLVMTLRQVKISLAQPLWDGGKEANTELN